ncbi:MAG: 2-amino-4-hydroxy-6-hydroxymethyldihydropteridine diphosphokinase [Litorimonas sp.]
MTECLIAFGGNLSNPKVTFQIALAELCAEGFHLEKKSGLWRSPAWPAGSDQPNYLNAVVLGNYHGSAQSLLDLLQSIENKHGRVRSIPNAARTLDLDILTFGSETCNQKDLKLPHPRMLERAFVLVPASELQEKWVKYTRRLTGADIKATRYVGAW